MLSYSLFVVCLFACRLSVTRVYCDKTAEARMTQFSLKCSPMSITIRLPSLTTRFKGGPVDWGLKLTNILVLLPCWIQWWKNFKIRPTLAKLLTKNIVGFFDSHCRTNPICHLLSSWKNHSMISVKRGLTRALIIAHWTTVWLSTASPPSWRLPVFNERLSRRLCLYSL